MKKQFFDLLPKDAFSLVNKDDKNAIFMQQNTVSKKVSYAINTYADFNLKVLESTFSGMLLNINNNEIWTHLLGDFNASNLLAVYAVSVITGNEKFFFIKETFSFILKIFFLKNLKFFKLLANSYIIIMFNI